MFVMLEKEEDGEVSVNCIAICIPICVCMGECGIRLLVYDLLYSWFDIELTGCGISNSIRNMNE